MQVSTRARRLFSTVLAVTLAVESVTAVAAAAATSTVTQGATAESPAAQALAVGAVGMTVPAAAPAVAAYVAPRFVAPAIVEPREVTAPARATVTAPARVVVPDRAPKVATAPKSPTKAVKSPTKAVKSPKPAAKPKAKATPKAARPATYAGTNHVWIPSLGISKSVRSFPCSRTRPPDNLMYRWGCAGDNNVYLMGHASSVMAPLHDAYVRGRLRAGMKAYYAGSNGKVHVYAVRWWKLTRPTTDAAWAWAAQAAPSMTLQTCVGAHSEYRLMVRLTQVDG